MGIGHMGVALAAKRLAPRASLGVLFLAAELLDLLWPFFLLLGLEHVRISPGWTLLSPFDFYDYPITHSLATALGWSLVAGLGYYAVRRDLRAAWVIGIAVTSHWVLDAVVHRPDLPLAPGSGVYAGFGLWNSRAATTIAEAGIFLAGTVLYLRSTAARDAAGRYGLWALLALCAIIGVGTWVGQPPPPSVRALAIGGLGLWLFLPWAWWADRHRGPAQ